jgi:hypothetical protein
MNQKVKQRFQKYLWLLNILKKLRYGHLSGAGSGSGSGSGCFRKSDSDPDPVKIHPDPQHWSAAWSSMTPGYVVATCKKFRPRLEAVVRAGGAHIEGLDV